MLIPLLLGCVTLFITMGIQISAVVYTLNYLFKFVDRVDARHTAQQELKHKSKRTTVFLISMVMTMLFIGNLIQAAIWAALFLELGEFTDFTTAFYHSMVNFASLGYGDIVMSEKWRLLGAIEASNGVLMFGLSAGTMLSIMNWILAFDSRLKDKVAHLKERKANH
ncbi:MAG TPA: ion channel [Xanthomonadales bacterium]